VRTVEVNRADIRATRVVDEPTPEPGPGEALLRVDLFGLTANNVTYAALGDLLSYWRFFPAADGWGRVPVWGFAEVVASRAEGVATGDRVFGYLPMSTHLVVRPDRAGPTGFVDAAPHRRELPAAYNRYRTGPVEGGEPAYALLWPLFVLAFLVADHLDEHKLFGADQALLASASSRTARAIAHLLRQRGDGRVLGLTSAGRVAAMRDGGEYHAVAAYDRPADLPDGATVLVDMSGNPQVASAVADRYGPALVRSIAVGATHWDTVRPQGTVRREDTRDAARPGDATRPGGTGDAVFFFAPDQLRHRAEQWGREELESRMAKAWNGFVAAAGGWLRIDAGHGPDAVLAAYHEVVSGAADPAVGRVLSLHAE